jgi:NAD(P)-dependent dehydrogenase (short-subunit alcohol dehydrogenase family)
VLLHRLLHHPTWWSSAAEGEWRHAEAASGQANRVRRPRILGRVEELDQHLAINVRGTYLLCREFTDRYRSEHGPGRIVSFLSGRPLIGSVAYVASKGAVHRMGMSMAGEPTSRGITFNAIDPDHTCTGWMSPELKSRPSMSNPIGRVSDPYDAANLVQFLPSDQGGWLNAQFLRSDGGFSQLPGPGTAAQARASQAMTRSDQGVIDPT